MNQQDLAPNASVTVSGDIAHVVLGEIDLSVPVQHLDAMIRMLEGCRLIAQSTRLHSDSGATSGANPPPVDDAGTEGISKDASKRWAADPMQNSRPKRRSRKRVGDALVVWMRQNPGWRHEEELLSVVIEHEMTDASPKRALKIALGKQRGDLFVNDALGRWKLRDQTAKESPSLADGEPRQLRASMPSPSPRGKNLGTAIPQKDALKDEEAAGRLSVQDAPLDGKTAATGVVRRRKAKDGKKPSHTSRQAHGEGGLSDISVDDWKPSFSRADVQQAKGHLLSKGRSIDTSTRRRGSLPEA